MPSRLPNKWTFLVPIFNRAADVHSSLRFNLFQIFIASKVTVNLVGTFDTAKL
jgi:hypothetical protein